jgi:hypothetical protein
VCSACNIGVQPFFLGFLGDQRQQYTALTLGAEAADETSLRQIEDLLTVRLEKFGRREHLTVTRQLLREQ